MKMKVLEEQCRGLEGELARVRDEVLKMVEEREKLNSDKQSLEEKLNQSQAQKVCFLLFFQLFWLNIFMIHFLVDFII